MTMHDTERLRGAINRLGAVLAGIVATAEEKSRERCPYKTVELACTFPGGCMNQMREARLVRCGGDHLIEWGPPPARDQRP